MSRDDLLALTAAEAAAKIAAGETNSENLVAACLDRIERADYENSLEDDARLELIRQGIRILESPGLDRAEQIQMLFSDRYEPNWHKTPARG